MTIEEVKKYLGSIDLFNNPSVRELGVGNNYQVFRVDDISGSYTLRVKKDNTPAIDLLVKEYFILEFLAECKIDFAPRPVYLDQERGVSILTFVDGHSVGVNDLNQEQIEELVIKLNILHRLSYKKYQNFCTKRGVVPEKPMSPVEHFQVSGLDRFEYIDQNCQRRDLVEWIRPRLLANFEVVKNTICSEDDIIFCHRDVAGANIFIDQGKIFLIDWDKAKFLYNTDYYLNFMFIHGFVHHNKQEIIINAYARENNIDPEVLRHRINERMKITRLNDVIWAVMMYTESISKNLGNPQEYLELAQRRMEV